MKYVSMRVLACHVIFFLLILLVNINSTPKVIGDENVYVQSVWTLVDGKIDNNDHPLFAKTIWLFFVFLGNGYWGMDFGIFWRIGTIILSILSLLVFYKIALFFFKKRVSSILTVLLAIDPMYFAFSRIVHLEIPSLFFLLLSLYFFLKFQTKKNYRNLFYSSFMLGLSLSAKLLALGVFGLILFYVVLTNVREGGIKLKSFYTTATFIIFVLLGFYLGNIIFFFKDAGGISFFDYAYDLIHSQISSERLVGNYQFSPAWTWFLVPQIISLYRINLINRVESIVAFQNPIFFISTLFSVFYAFILVFKDNKKNRNLLVILLYFLGLYLPWFMQLHNTFYYYIIPMVPMVIILTTLTIYKLFDKPLKILKVFLIFSIILFAISYPLLVGVNLPKKYDLFVYKYSQFKYPEFNTLFCQNCFPRK